MDQNTVNRIVEAGAAAVGAQSRVIKYELDGVEVPLALKQQGNAISVEVLEAAVAFADQRAPHPRVRTGTSSLDDLASLVAFVNRQKLEGSTVAFVDARPRAVVIFDWHEPHAGVCGWGADRAVYAPPISRRWRTWLDESGKPIAQDEFADFLEDNLDDISESKGAPKKLDLLQMARDLHVHVGAKFQRTVDPSTGDVNLVSVVDSGQSRTKIPREFVVALPLFEGSEIAYAIRFGLKLELKGDKAFFTMRPRNADTAKDDAIAGLRKAIAEQCAIPVFAGVP